MAFAARYSLVKNDHGFSFTAARNGFFKAIFTSVLPMWFISEQALYPVFSCNRQHWCIISWHCAKTSWPYAIRTRTRTRTTAAVNACQKKKVFQTVAGFTMTSSWNPPVFYLRQSLQAGSTHWFFFSLSLPSWFYLSLKWPTFSRGE